MYTYINNGGEIIIKTPVGINNLTDVTTEVLKQTPECIITKLSYPNGIILETHVYADRIEYISTHELIKNNNGEYEFKL